MGTQMAKKSRGVKTATNSDKNGTPAEQPNKGDEGAAELPAAQAEDYGLITRRIDNQIGRSAWIPEDLPKKEKLEHFNQMQAFFNNIKPKGPVEAMLAMQMVAAHEAAMACISRAKSACDGRWIDLHVKNAAKLMELYLRQVRALDKHRGKGQQTVTVEHVYVAAGGQALVGNVAAAATPSGNSSKKSALRKLTQSAEQLFSIAAPDEQSDEVLNMRDGQNGGNT